MTNSEERSNIVEAPFTEAMVKSAKGKAKRLGEIKNSILKGKGNFAGYLGESIVAEYIDAKIVSNKRGEEKYNHDLVLGNKTIEIKTKRRTVPPKDFYDASVAHTSRHQNPDFYVFVSIQFQGDKPVKAWICGQKKSTEYFKQATFYAKGDVDSSNGWKVLTDCYNLSYKDLDPIGT